VHAQVKRCLDVRRGRATGAVALEGRWALERALAAGVEIDAVITCPELLRGEPLDGSIEVGEKVFRRLTGRDGPDGIVALARLRDRTLDDVAPGDRVLVADGVELPGNVGTLVRTADGAGATAVIVCAPVRVSAPALVRASMGAVLWLPVVQANAPEAIAWLRANRCRVVVADPAARASYRDADYGPPAAIVVGSERHGVSSTWRCAADELVSIPMLGRSDSLNVGHAAALLLYEALHHHRRQT